MKSDLWIVFAVTAGFLGFIMGYSVPPVQEVGLYAMGHGGVAVEETAETDEELDQYKELEKLME
jgi:hypothetical protein